jgi:hypothetical protein
MFFNWKFGYLKVKKFKHINMARNNLDYTLKWIIDLISYVRQILEKYKYIGSLQRLFIIFKDANDSGDMSTSNILI